MLKESAVVMSYDVETGLAKVKCQSQSACGACSAREACGTASLSELNGAYRYARNHYATAYRPNGGNRPRRKIHVIFCIINVYRATFHVISCNITFQLYQ